ncbi:hypothetical protein BDN67DRAFT_1014944 [Paxillus ammoniavirescens]|nr:hypothetical protein BDN67DRAFT_1014944 [Paxillus ammoniavirescens]
MSLLTSFHVEENKLGYNFGIVKPKFDTDVVQAYTEFLDDVYGSDTNMKLAISTKMSGGRVDSKVKGAAGEESTEAEVENGEDGEGEEDDEGEKDKGDKEKATGVESTLYTQDSPNLSCSDGAIATPLHVALSLPIVIPPIHKQDLDKPLTHCLSSPYIFANPYLNFLSTGQVYGLFAPAQQNFNFLQNIPAIDYEAGIFNGSQLGYHSDGVPQTPSARLPHLPTDLPLLLSPSSSKSTDPLRDVAVQPAPVLLPMERGVIKFSKSNVPAVITNPDNGAAAEGLSKHKSLPL